MALPSFGVLGLLAALACAAESRAAVSVTDDAQRQVTLPGPARRIVSLAPHTTEMLFAAGAGAQVVGVTEFSDYPPEARKLPSVGSGVSLDFERILALKPDLIVGWNNGNTGTQLARFEALGIPLFKSEPHDLESIPSSMERLAHLAGTDAVGKRAADAFRARLERIAAAYRGRSVLRVFYQVWRSPLMTLNDAATPSSVLKLCGARNVFGNLRMIAPTVTVEAVLQEDPDVLLASTGEHDDPLAMWQRFPRMKAVARGHLLHVDGNLLNRDGPRILDGAEVLCRQLDAARGER
ncbi:cobalamin-binding protein [Noviherbaspirillum galbum]|uniref:Cobalamin-binding protein n=1 Tax=Noviherbaspirillum galbum TaxID=2709383 RepID=A0A6B3SV55_9BURK|nr:cobalamin-binding protein [Noviherbaspirillum galbum]NEX61519.1 cobalamin-binding protein [Noviherbaspirillum galbum]